MSNGLQFDEQSSQRIGRTVLEHEAAREGLQPRRRDVVLPQPNLRVMLLDDLYEGAYVPASIQRLIPTKSLQTVTVVPPTYPGQLTSTPHTHRADPDAIQTLRLYGFDINGQFKLTFQETGDPAQQTGFIQYNDNAATMLAALEALAMFNPGDIIVKSREGTWWVNYTGQWGRDLPTVTPNVDQDNLTGKKFSGLERTSVDVLAGTTTWIDTQELIEVTPSVPPPALDPFQAGTICWAEWHHEAGYCVTVAECRDLRTRARIGYGYY